MSERFVIHTFQKKVQFSNLNFFNSKTTLALELGMDEKAKKTMRKEKKEKNGHCQNVNTPNTLF